MPEVRFSIGGRFFDLACQPGEEGALKAAAALLDAQATALGPQIARTTEARMLLMAGLMLADQITTQGARIKELEEQLAQMTAPPKIIEVIPEDLVTILAQIAERAEFMAAKIDGDMNKTDAA